MKMENIQEQNQPQTREGKKEEEDNLTTPLASEGNRRSISPIYQRIGTPSQSINLTGSDRRRAWIDQDPARTPTSSFHPSSATERSPKPLGLAWDGGQDDYFAQRSTTQAQMHNQVSPSASKFPPSHKSGNSSSASLQSSVASDYSISASGEISAPTFGGDLSSVQQVALGKLLHVEKARSNSPTSGQSQVFSKPRQEGPHYPTQSFAALQPQQYPPIYHPHPLRTRSSNPSQNSSYTSSSSRMPRDRSSMNSGARTVGNTPIQSPGFFPAPSSKYRSADDLEDAQYSAPLLHSTHLQAPKE